jgi:hypothetical protein
MTAEEAMREYGRRWRAAQRAKIHTVTCRCVYCGREAEVTDRGGAWNSAVLKFDGQIEPTGWRCKDGC